MENDLLKYMSNRFFDEKTPVAEGGPVITISREYGCYASEIAELLCVALTKNAKHHHKNENWKFISREILEEAATELNSKPKSISHIFGAQEKGLLGDMIVSFSKKNYTSDNVIKKTITQIVRSYAQEGFVIIVGRAGCILARDFPKTLHIRLMAPFEWRMQRIVKRFGFTTEEAKNAVKECDLQRATFMSFFKGNKPDADLFDAVLNRSMMTTDEIVQTIIKILEVRKYIGT